MQGENFALHSSYILDIFVLIQLGLFNFYKICQFMIPDLTKITFMNFYQITTFPYHKLVLGYEQFF